MTSLDQLEALLAEYEDAEDDIRHVALNRSAVDALPDLLAAARALEKIERGPRDTVEDGPDGEPVIVVASDSEGYARCRSIARSALARAEARLEETEKALEDAIWAADYLADQQAMPDDGYVERLERGRAARASREDTGTGATKSMLDHVVIVTTWGTDAADDTYRVYGPYDRPRADELLDQLQALLLDTCHTAHARQLVASDADQIVARLSS